MAKEITRRVETVVATRTQNKIANVQPAQQLCQKHVILDGLKQVENFYKKPLSQRTKQEEARVALSIFGNIKNSEIPDLINQMPDVTQAELLRMLQG